VRIAAVRRRFVQRIAYRLTESTRMPRKRKRSKLWPPPELTEAQILKWVDAFHTLTGHWPTRHHYRKPLLGAPAELWSDQLGTSGGGPRPARRFVVTSLARCQAGCAQPEGPSPFHC
jgi:hypothetical protein